MNTPAIGNARNILSQEELDFLLAPQTGGGTLKKAADGTADASGQTGAAAGRKAKGQGRGRARKPAVGGGSMPPGSADGTREQKRFFAITLERVLRRATGNFVGIRFDGDRTFSPDALTRCAGAPACFVELASRRGEGIVFCLDNQAVQALANASLGAGRGPARTEGPLSLLDRALVQRCLHNLGLAYAQAFDCPCAACVRLAWYGDELFRTRGEKDFSAAEFSMETAGQLGHAWLLIPEGQA